MKRYLFTLFILIVFFFFEVKFANAGVVTYPTEANIFLASSNITLVVESNSSADSIIVSDNDITVTVSAPDSFVLRSDDKYNLVNNGNYGISCESISKLVIQPPSGTQTIIITPTTEICIASTPTPTLTSTSTTNSSTTNNDSSPSAPSCTDQSPGAKAPWLYGAIARGGSSVLLYFTEADDPVDSYALEYGVKSGEYKWAASDIGGKGSRTYLVKSLSANTTYYFRVRGGNGCATGAWSNEISASTGGLISFNQLDFVSSDLQPAVAKQEEVVGACQTYTVESGDSLWGIAASEMRDGALFKQIVEQNRDSYPSLGSSNNLDVGWELKLNCDTQQALQEAEEDGQEAGEEARGGYSINVRVNDTDQNPVEGAKVTIHSKVQEATTDSNGVAQFTNVEPGDHRVLIAYDNYTGEQSINLSGEVGEFDLNITIQQKSVLTSPLVLSIISGMLLVIVVLGGLLMRAKSRKI